VDDQLPRLESTIDELRHAVRSLESRVAALEARPGPAPEVQTGPGQAPAESTAPDGPAAGRDWRDPVFIGTLLGRLLLVLGGGFFLRAETEAGTLLPAVGVAIGFAYGLVWLVFADRAGRRGQTHAAFFHAVAAALVAFPLVYEATIKFGVLPGPWSAAALAVLTAGLLAVAVRRRLRAVAWIPVLVGIPTSIVLLAVSDIVVPHAFFLIAFGVASLWIGYSLDWLIARWPVALAADLVVFGVTMRALGAQHQESPGMALLVQMTLLIAYLASIAIRTLVRGRNVIPFEVLQTIAALVVGLGGAISVTRATGAGTMTLAGANLLAGAACYGVAFAFIDRQQDRGRNVYFYTTLALVLVLVGSNLLLPATALDLTCAALAVVACVLWGRSGRLFLLIHGAAYLLAAGVASGTLSYAVWGFASGQTGVWRQPGLGAPVVAAAGLLAAWLAAGAASDGAPLLARWPRFVIILVAVTAIGGVAVGLLAPVLAGAASGTVDPGGLATLRTVVLAVAALAVAWVGRHNAYREWSWLVYPLLVVTGLKMVAQDFMQSRPATMFVALAVYGAALILAPRLRRRQA
jgi:hypothetical protein